MKPKVRVTNLDDEAVQTELPLIAKRVARKFISGNFTIREIAKKVSTFSPAKAAKELKQLLKSKGADFVENVLRNWPT
jgi:hypothetical protein